MSELRAPVDDEVARRLGTKPAPIADIDHLLTHPVDVATATRVALANNARLAAAFDELGIAGGELAEATSIGPLQADVQLRYGGGGSGPRASEHEFEVIQPVLGLIDMPRRRAAAHADLAVARANATAMAIRLAARVDIAFRDVLAAQQEIELRKTAFDAADVAATLRERMRAAGNTTELAVARDEDAREQARIELVRATADVTARKLRVDALLGLGHLATDWLPAGAIDELPAVEPPLDTVENDAVAASLALVAGTSRVDAAKERLSDERLRSWLPDLGVGASAIDHDGSLEVGPAVRVGLPLFDWRSGPRAQATARLAGAQHALIADATELRTRARAVAVEAHAAYAEARALHDTVLPLRQKIVDETLAHYNAMDADPFQLVVARRELVAAGHAYLDALRRYGNAMAEVTALRRGVALEEMP
jgi:cobalt-zinc-cadmium efflux system outer membrane protein